MIKVEKYKNKLGATHQCSVCFSPHISFYYIEIMYQSSILCYECLEELNDKIIKSKEKINE